LALGGGGWIVLWIVWVWEEGATQGLKPTSLRPLNAKAEALAYLEATTKVVLAQTFGLGCDGARGWR
jgi:hypothetical protein